MFIFSLAPASQTLRHQSGDYSKELTSAYSTAQKMKFSIKDFFSKCDQIRRNLQIWSHLLKISLMKNFIFLCSVSLGIGEIMLCRLQLLMMYVGYERKYYVSSTL